MPAFTVKREAQEEKFKFIGTQTLTRDDERKAESTNIGGEIISLASSYGTLVDKFEIQQFLPCEALDANEVKRVSDSFNELST